MTYYVAVTGDDGNVGTQDSPFKTIQRGIDAAGPGDTVHAAAGVYQEHPQITHGGTISRPLTIEGESGAVIDGSFPGFTPKWTLIEGYGGGVYTTSVPAETNCVTMDDQTLTDLWWGVETGPDSVEGCRPIASKPDFLHPYHYARLFEHSYADVPGLPDCEGTWSWSPEGWDACRGLALWIPGEDGGTLWVKCKPGNNADPLDITKRNVAIAPCDVPVVKIDGADHVILRGFTIKNGYWGIHLFNSIGTIIEHCTLSPTYNGIRVNANTDGIILRYNEISMNHYANTSTKSRGGNVWAMSKFLLQNRHKYGTAGYAADKVAIECLNSIGNVRFHDNYIHEAGVGISTGWHGSPEQEKLCNTNIEVDHNLLRHNYQDAFSVGKNCANHKWHDNIVDDVLQYVRYFGVWYGPLYIYNNIFINGPLTNMSLVGFSDSKGFTPDIYFYNNTLFDPADAPYITSSCFYNNRFDPSKIGLPNFHYYNNLFWTDLFCQVNHGSDANWDGNYNVYVQRSAWKQSVDAAGTHLDNWEYAKARGIDLNSLWTTASPGFADAARGDVSLTAESPARDAGTDLVERFGKLPGSPSKDCGALAYGVAMPRVPRTQDGPPSEPYVSSVSVTGTSVTIMGSYLTGATEVSFGGAPATDVVVGVAGTQLVCTAPKHEAGEVVVTVTTGAGTSNGVGFTYGVLWRSAGTSRQGVTSESLTQ